MSPSLLILYQLFFLQKTTTMKKVLLLAIPSIFLTLSIYAQRRVQFPGISTSYMHIDSLVTERIGNKIYSTFHVNVTTAGARKLEFWLMGARDYFGNNSSYPLIVDGVVSDTVMMKTC